MQEWNPSVIRAKQLLTMAPKAGHDPICETPNHADLDALRARDHALVGLIEDGAVAMEGDRIAWVGPFAKLPKRFKNLPTANVECATPGWIDCHTHTVFAGSRHLEFAQRNLGASYLDLLNNGGGILNTVRAVRSSKTNTLRDLLVERCFECTRLGITTLEVKSGYGLDLDQERKLLKAIRNAQPHVFVDLQPTLLAAHALPVSYKDRREEFIDLVCDTIIPKVASEKLARFCDIFCDKGVFTPDEARRVLRAGLEHGLIPKIHADELSPAGAAEVAVDVQAASADHLEYISEEAIRGMAENDVTAVLLPAVNVYLDHAQRAPARTLLQSGVRVALASDYNPGTAPVQSLELVMTLASTLLKMTPGECLRAITASASHALHLHEDRGTLEPGKRADLTITTVDDYWQLPYSTGSSKVDGVIVAGELVYWRSADELEV